MRLKSASYMPQASKAELTLVKIKLNRKLGLFFYQQTETIKSIKINKLNRASTIFLYPSIFFFLSRF
ncbi:hypothetical protein ALTERO38_60784 [Alteromonas sp. 38]|nr:hypothetical protein ALTER154_40011 [Alteromonas sp. 154]VXC33337.1 hypothetical protein ALTERO38_60784 [Alteromonas sp. 38]